MTNRKALKSNQVDTLAAPDPWKSKMVSINLSKQRRAALLAFADSCELSLTPAQALYSLIDLIERAPDAQCDEASDLSERVDAAHLAEIVRRLDAMEQTNELTARALNACAETMAQLLSGISELHDSHSRDAAPPKEDRPDALAAQTARSPTDWCEKVSRIYKVDSLAGSSFDLRYADKLKASEHDIVLIFEATQRGFVLNGPENESTKLPRLMLADRLDGALSTCVRVEPGARLMLSIDKAQSENVVGRVSLRMDKNRRGPTMLQFPVAPHKS